MVYVANRNAKNKGKEMDKGFGITDSDKKRAVATDFVIDTNKRKVSDKVNESEPKMSD